MNELMDRLKMYEPLFGQWKVDFIAMNYEDMAWVYLIDDRGSENEYALMKVKTIQCAEGEVERNVYDLMMKYDVMTFPDLTNSPYLQEEHYYIENDNQIVGTDICLLSAISQLEDEETPLLEEDLFQLALKYMNGNERVQDEYHAYELYEKAARSNHAKSICSLGYMNEVGLGTPIDKEKAVAYYHQAADLDDEIAACNYAFCCFEGIGCEVNDEQAFEYFEKAAAKNHPRALFYLGECYCFGRGVDKDEMKAMTHYKQAADLDFTQAKYSVGYCYEYGIGLSTGFKFCCFLVSGSC